MQCKRLNDIIYVAFYSIFKGVRKMSKNIFLEIDDSPKGFEFDLNIQDALAQAQFETDQINESINSIQILKPECDKIDYSLAVSSGAICGMIDIFLVGEPGNSNLQGNTDNWFENKTKEFAKLCGWPGDPNDPDSGASAKRYLENKFKVNYDQRGAGDAGNAVFNLDPKNHHWKSLGHNPSLIGLFFSIVDQFTGQSHFVTEGQLVALQQADEGVELRGSNIPSKIFSGFVNWVGHLMSDISGSSGSKGRGMGIPSPLWTWTNDIIVIKSKLRIPPSEFDKSVNKLAEKMYTEGYDARFQATQAIPVFLNEMIVRFFYTIRRAIKYFSNKGDEKFSFQSLWQACEPFSNVTVKRMLTVAHGTFCLLDIGDATVRAFAEGAGVFDPYKFFMRLNIVGVGRITISLYGEAKLGVENFNKQNDLNQLNRDKKIVENYLQGLKELSIIYDDRNLITFIKDFKNSKAYIKAFEASIELAKKRGAQDILLTKQAGDNYFRGLTD